MRGAEGIEVEDEEEKEEDKAEEENDGLSQRAAEDRDEPRERTLDGAGGWYRRAPIVAREVGGERLEDERDRGDEVLEDERNEGGGREVPRLGMEEGRRPKALGSPATVSQKMKDEHEVTHLPYRSWCAHCVSGRGRSVNHRGKKDEDKDAIIPRVAMDYFYMHASVGGTDDDRSPSVLMVNELTGERYARMVAKKGVGMEVDWVVRDMVEELKVWGMQEVLQTN